MYELRKRFARFMLKNKDRGIPNLMLIVMVGNLIVYALSAIDPSYVVYSWLRFDRNAILHGQLWRLVSYIFTYLIDSGGMSLFMGLLTLFCYYQFGKILEQLWGRFKFNLYYLTGVIMIDLAAILLHGFASTHFLNLSLFLAIATIAPNAQVLLFFFIPIKMKYMAWVYLGFTALEVIGGLMAGPLGLSWLYPVLALLNYFLFFGGQIRNVFSSGYSRPKAPRAPHARPNPNWASDYRGKNGERPYRHKCTVCGRTDTQYPNLEFRYCSKCSGYYCYCTEHLNNHAHIQ